MKINKAKLLKAIDAAEATEKRKVADYEAAKGLYLSQLRAAWYRDELPRLQDLRDMLSTAIRRKWLVTSDMVHDALGVQGHQYYSGTLPTWREPSVNDFTFDGERYYKIAPQTARYAALRKTLEAIEDETVAPTALSSIGLKDIATLMRAAVE